MGELRRGGAARAGGADGARGSEPRRTSPTRCCSSPATSPDGSAGRCCRWMGGSEARPGRCPGPAGAAGPRPLRMIATPVNSTSRTLPTVSFRKGRAISSDRGSDGTVSAGRIPSWSAKADHPQLSPRRPLSDPCTREGSGRDSEGGERWLALHHDKPAERHPLCRGDGGFARRVWEHRDGSASQFTRRYGLQRLAYAERHDDIRAAIQREKTFKGWRRAWKVRLIVSRNPDWTDLNQPLGREAGPRRCPGSRQKTWMAGLRRP